MARNVLVPIAMSRTAKVPHGAGTAIAGLIANGAIVSGVPLEELVVMVTNTFAGAKITTIRKGANPPALSAGQGDMTGSQAQNEVAMYGPFESARFSQGAGTVGDPQKDALWIDFEAAMTGFVWVFRVPRA